MKIVACFFFCLTNAFLIAQENLVIDKLPFEARNYVSYWSDESVTINGKLTEKMWQNTPWSAPFVDIEGSKKPLPTYETKVKIAWDNEFLYFAAQLEEPHLWATLRERESVIFHDNDFEIFLDPDGDTHLYYEFEVNALGTEWDLLLAKPYRNGGPAINGWNINGMKVGIDLQGTLNDPSDVDQGWTIEVAMPWEILKECAPFKTLPEDGDQWRIDFSRVQWRLDKENGQYSKTINPKTGESFPEYNWVWSPPGLINMHQPEKWGFLQFSKNNPTKSVEFEHKSSELEKWALREIYYKQEAFFEKSGKYAEKLKELNIKQVLINGRKYKIDLSATKGQYEAKLKSAESETWWIISDDGKVWSE